MADAPRNEAEPTPWSVYLVRCGDGSLYTGIANDVARRFEEHREGERKCAKYLRGRGPLRLVFERRIGERGLALSVESSIKRLSRERKEALIAPGGPIEALVAQAQGDLERRVR